jgi:outer membrane murein-binding lipoprotein Lpp
METRIDKLESAVINFTAQIASVREDVAVIKSNYATKDDLAALKGEVDVIKSNYATKEDLAKMESTILKVFITTAIMLTGVVFGVVKYIH